MSCAARRLLTRPTEPEQPLVTLSGRLSLIVDYVQGAYYAGVDVAAMLERESESDWTVRAY